MVFRVQHTSDTAVRKIIRAIGHVEDAQLLKIEIRQVKINKIDLHEQWGNWQSTRG